MTGKDTLITKTTNVEISELERQLLGWRLTTAQIIYRMPDHPAILQEFLWQDYDLAPLFPELTKFLSFWQKQLDGPLHSVRVGATELVKPAELKFAGAELRLN